MKARGDPAREASQVDGPPCHIPSGSLFELSHLNAARLVPSLNL
jgi:hypothetical protein